MIDTRSVAPSGATNIHSASGPTAHAVGYFLPPLRGSRRPNTLLSGRWEAAPDCSINPLRGITASDW